MLTTASPNAAAVVYLPATTFSLEKRGKGARNHLRVRSLFNEQLPHVFQMSLQLLRPKLTILHAF